MLTIEEATLKRWLQSDLTKGLIRHLLVDNTPDYMIVSGGFSSIY